MLRTILQDAGYFTPIKGVYTPDKATLVFDGQKVVVLVFFNFFDIQ